MPDIWIDRSFWRIAKKMGTIEGGYIAAGNNRNTVNATRIKKYKLLEFKHICYMHIKSKSTTFMEVI